MKFILISIFLFLCVSNFCEAQTVVSGKILDAVTGEPIPFANIVFKGTRLGTTSDFDGNYVLKTNLKVDSLQVSFIGYINQSKAIKKNQTQVLNISLNANEFAMKEIVIKPGKNPAIVLLEKVIDHKPDNNRDKYETYQYQVYNKLEFDLNNIGNKMKKSRFVKPFDFAFSNIDSSNKNEKPFLPFFLSETLSDFYYQKNPQQKKEVIKASKVAGVKNESVSAVLGDMYQNVNIYDNTVLVFGKGFVSPISSTGTFFYKYYLVDSSFIDNNWTYHIKFTPRRKQELTFDGNMWIHDTSFAIRRIEMKIADDANINFVNSLYVVQDFNRADNKHWLLTKDKLVVEFTYKDKAPGLYGRKTSKYYDVKFDDKREKGFFDANKSTTFEDSAMHRDAHYWNKYRPDSLSKNEASIYKLVDTIKTLAVFRTYETVVQLLFTGYKSYKWSNIWEWGPIFSTISFNNVEKVRLRLGGRTNKYFSKAFQLSGYFAYGLGDPTNQPYKYGAGIKFKPKGFSRWNLTNLSLKDDYELLGQGNSLITADNLFVTIFRRRPITDSDLVRTRRIELSHEVEIANGLQIKPGISHRDVSVIGSNRFDYIDNSGIIQNRNTISTTEFNFFVRYASGEKYIEDVFRRKSLGTRSPVLQLRYSGSVKNFLFGQYNYQKVVVNVQDKIRLLPIGYFDYTLEFGQIFSNESLPYPILEIHAGNESYAYDKNAYTLMNYFEFVSDKYYSASITHHFDGFFFNKIPLFRKLQLREVFQAKVVGGSLSKKNTTEVLLPWRTHTLTFTDPYGEVGVGIENIFKFFRIDAVWRVNYVDKVKYNNPTIFGIRATAQLIF